MRQVLVLTPDHAHTQDTLGGVYRDPLAGALSQYKGVVRLERCHSRAVLQLAVAHENARPYRAASTLVECSDRRRGG